VKVLVGKGEAAGAAGCANRPVVGACKLVAGLLFDSNGFWVDVLSGCVDVLKPPKGFVVRSCVVFDWVEPALLVWGLAVAPPNILPKVLPACAGVESFSAVVFVLNMLPAVAGVFKGCACVLAPNAEEKVPEEAEALGVVPPKRLLISAVVVFPPSDLLAPSVLAMGILVLDGPVVLGVLVAGNLNVPDAPVEPLFAVPWKSKPLGVAELPKREALAGALAGALGAAKLLEAGLPKEPKPVDCKPAPLCCVCDGCVTPQGTGLVSCVASGAGAVKASVLLSVPGVPKLGF